MNSRLRLPHFARDSASFNKRPETAAKPETAKEKERSMAETTLHNNAEIPLSKADDARLIEGILSGEAESFDALYRRYERRIFYFALKRLGDRQEAEDVTQEVFLQVHCGLSRYEGRSTLLTWMFGIAHNQVCRRFRRKSPKTISLDVSDVHDLSSDAPSAERQTDIVRVLRNCSRVLDEKVSPDQKAVFNLRYVDNHSTRSIAEELGKSTQAVKISLFRTRRTLADHNRELGVLLSA
jgi:RNA polymerase sigma-70 factor (ECF subfamily)